TDTGILRHALARHGLAAPSAAMQAGFEQDLAERFRAAMATAPIREIAGASAFTRWLNDSDWAVVYATGGVRAVSGLKLDAAGIVYRPDALFTASEEPSRDALVARAVAHARQRHPQARDGMVLSMGDGRWDLEVAARLGLRFLGVGATAQARLQAERGARVMRDLTGAAAAMTRLAAA
uniref:HAD family hydrolase n=1 Tax=Achromobacter insuavis TaxID=1287735 RepID=UPI0035A1D0C0